MAPVAHLAYLVLLLLLAGLLAVAAFRSGA
jgi:hypothetical protein